MRRFTGGCPSLLIATVDKFAQMPWKGEVEMLFGQVDGLCERHGFRSPEIDDAGSHPKTKDGKFGAARTIPANALRPPDLIIQDELHLISGPLGTLVGLYETAIDRLCSWKVGGRMVRPKLIASTATIRQAKDQVHALFMRDTQRLPAQRPGRAGQLLLVAATLERGHAGPEVHRDLCPGSRTCGTA